MDARLPNATVSIVSDNMLFSNILDPSTLRIDGGDLYMGGGGLQFGTGNSMTGMLSYGISSMDLTPVPVPPASLLLGSGLLGLVALRRRLRE